MHLLNNYQLTTKHIQDQAILHTYQLRISLLQRVSGKKASSFLLLFIVHRRRFLFFDNTLHLFERYRYKVIIVYPNIIL